MTRLLLTALLAGAFVEPQAVVHGVAAQHRSLERVARVRGMKTTGVLFASPLVPLGTRLCVTSRHARTTLCGVVVDVPQPQHRRWQLETGRIIEVQPAIARILCADPTGPPRHCKVTVWRE